MVRVRRWSYGRTREVAKHETYVTVAITEWDSNFSLLSNFPSASITRQTHANHEPIAL